MCLQERQNQISATFQRQQKQYFKQILRLHYKTTKIKLYCQLSRNQTLALNWFFLKATELIHIF